MSLSTARDVPLQVLSSTGGVVRSERRITPSWTLAQLKGKLEPITGVPPASQRLVLRVPGRADAVLQADNEEEVQVGSWGLTAQAELVVEDTRPPGTRNLDFTDLDSVTKYEMPIDQYQTLPSTVLAYKKAHSIGRFDPNAPEAERQKIEALWTDAASRKIVVGGRCQLGADSPRRGQIAYVGEVPEIPGSKGPWIGVRLDEPLGKNDGTVGGKSYFSCPKNCGVFVRPDRVEMGDFAPLTDSGDEDLMEEI